MRCENQGSSETFRQMRWVFVAVEFFWTCARSSDPQTEATEEKQWAHLQALPAVAAGRRQTQQSGFAPRSTGIDVGINVGNQLQPNRLLKFHSTLASNALVRGYD